MSALISVFLRDRNNILFNGEVSAITSINAAGKFDILPEHNNFISLVKDYVLLHLPDGSQKTFPCTNALIKFTSNKAKILFGISESTEVVGKKK